MASTPHLTSTYTLKVYMCLSSSNGEPFRLKLVSPLSSPILPYVGGGQMTYNNVAATIYWLS